MKKKILASVLYIILPMVFCTLWSVDVFGLKCGEINDDYNSSISYACDMYASTGIQRGIMWISSYSGGYDLKSGIYSEADGANIKVYLHGGAIGTTSLPANSIKIVKDKGYRIYGTAAGEAAYSPLKFSPGFNGRMDRLGVVYPWSQDIRSSVVSMTLDVNELRAVEGDNCKESGGMIRCNVRVQVFRCASGYSPGTGYSSRAGCYSDPLDVKIDILANNFTGRASVAEGTNWDGTTNQATTNWQKTSSSKSISLNCPNNGCKANYWLEIASSSGSGTAHYWTATQKNNGDWAWLPSYNNYNKLANPAKNGTVVLGKNKNEGQVVTLMPGEKVCKQLWLRIQDKQTSSDPHAELTACATAKITEFKGASLVAPVSNESLRDHFNTGWRTTDSDTSRNIFKISNCPTTGCKIKFFHDLASDNFNAGSTDYEISRTVNGTSVSGDYGRGTFSQRDRKTVRTNEATLYPGMVICEKMTFKPSNDATKEVKTIRTEVCAAAIGTSGATTLEMKAKNENVTKYNNFNNNTIYAKPGDKITFQATYNPVAQTAYNIVPWNNTAVQINGASNINGNGTSTISALFNHRSNCLQESSKCWRNAFNIAGTNITFNKDFIYKNGETDKKTETNTHTVTHGLAGNVGTELKEVAKTNVNSRVTTTPKQVTFTATEISANRVKSLFANVDTSQISGEAKVVVPFNFILNTKISSAEDTVLYAGESASFKMVGVISPKTNSLTTNGSASEAYVTSIRSGRRKLKFCVGGNLNNCPAGRLYTTEDKPWQHSIESTQDAKSEKESGEITLIINIPDVPAGTQFCAASMIYPKDSGPENNTNYKYYDINSDSSWKTSAEKCFKIAKKPSIQVWGGNVYSGGNITTAVSNKNNLAGYVDYKPTGNTEKTYTFGSWGELGIIAGGTVSGFASGASTGYDGVNRAANPGGSVGTNSNFCLRSPLSFANDKCNGANGKTGNISVNSVSNSATNIVNNDKKSILDKFGGIKGSQPNVTGGSVNLNDSSKINNNNVYYYYGKSGFSVAGGTVNKGTIQVMYAEGNDITIAGDLVYENAKYTLLEQSSTATGTAMPKLLIMAKNIKINCGVNRIDALLIADSTVDTCDGSSDINAMENSNQLKINGAIIAKRLVANRTYGASTGNQSIIPAEIINYDPSLFLWGNLGSGGSGDGDSSSSSESGSGGDRTYLDITYSRELAPRD